MELNLNLRKLAPVALHSLAAVGVGVILGRLINTHVDSDVDGIDPPSCLLAYFEGVVNHDAAQVWNNQSPSLIEALANAHPPISQESFYRAFDKGFHDLSFHSPTIEGGYLSGDQGNWIVSVIVKDDSNEIERVYLVTTDADGRVKNINN